MTRNKGAAPAPPVRPKPSVKFSNSANANDGNSKVPLLLEKAIMKYVYSKASHPYLCSNRRRQGIHWSCSSTSSPGTLKCLERGDVRSSSYNLRWVALTIGLYVLTRSSHVIRIGLNRYTLRVALSIFPGQSRPLSEEVAFCRGGATQGKSGTQ